MEFSWIRGVFGPRVLEEAESRFNGLLRVIKNSGSVYISTGILTQTGGLIKDVWEPTIKKLTKTSSTDPESFLILGLAGGTLARLISRYFSGALITGVEIDPLMIRLGKKYLSLDRIPGLKIVQADANSYILNHKSLFDVILVDLYLGDRVPGFVYGEKFLRQLKKTGKSVIINHLFYDPAKKAAAGELVKKLEIIFPIVSLQRRLTNLLIICTHNRV